MDSLSIPHARGEADLIDLLVYVCVWSAADHSDSRYNGASR